LYIDWNQDYVFNETSERVSYNSLTGQITVPADAVAGVTRFRVILTQPSLGLMTACGHKIRGETEDYTIQVLSAIEDTSFIQNIAVSNGQDTCFNALQIIAVAGNGTSFVVEDGGSATLVAGQKISFLEGSKVISGGYLHGYIDMDGTFCGSIPSIPAVIKSGIEELFYHSSQSLFRVYPNPTTGDFILEMLYDNGYVNANVEIYSMRGERVLQSEISGKAEYGLSLSGQPAGIYLVRILVGGKSETARIIKQ
jgi:hypothetical protein